MIYFFVHKFVIQKQNRLTKSLHIKLSRFPSKYIHIGGDEAPKYHWENCSKCQKRIIDNNLKDEHELQSYFIKRIGDFLKTKNKRLIGWDEIIEGGIPENAVIQSWRGMEGGIIAAKNRNQAIMSPTSHCYFDYDLDAINLEKVYSWIFKSHKCPIAFMPSPTI